MRRARRARWSRDMSQLRHGRINKIERAIAQSGVLDDHEEEEEDEDEDQDEVSGAEKNGGAPVQLLTDSSAGRRASIGPMELSGFLLKKSGVFSGQRKRYFVLKEGTLLWYKSERDRTPAGFCHLCDCASIEEYRRSDNSGSSARSGLVRRISRHASSSDGSGSGAMPGLVGRLSRHASSRRSSSDDVLDDGRVDPLPPNEGSAGESSIEEACPFRLRAHKDYILWADDVYDRDKWIRALQHNKDYPPLTGIGGSSRSSDSTAGGASSRRSDTGVGGGRGAASLQPSGPSKRSMLGSLALKAEKKLVGRAVTSDLGKKLLREYCLPDTFVLLQAMRDVASIDPAMPPKHGAKVEDTILKMACKVVLLYRHSILTPRDFDAAAGLVDTIAVDIVRKYDAVCRSPYADLFDEDHERMAVHMRALSAELKLLLSPHVTPKNVSALVDVVEYFGAPLNMARFLKEQRCLGELAKMANALRKMYGLDEPNMPGASPSAPSNAACSGKI